MQPALQKINIIGDWYFHHFRMGDGSSKDVETTQADYAQLSLPGAVIPSINDGIWIGSDARRKFDSASGNLEKGQYAQDGSNFHSCDSDGHITTSRSLSDLNAKINAIQSLQDSVNTK